LVEFIVVNVEDEVDYSCFSNKNKLDEVSTSSRRSSKSTNINYKNRSFNFKIPSCNIRRIDVLLASKGSNTNNTLFSVRSHIKDNIRAGDTVMGYDFTAINLEGEIEGIIQNSDKVPDVILVKRKFKRGKRIWKLKHIEKEDGNKVKQSKMQIENEANQYEEFLKDIEEDKPMRKLMNIYKDEAAIKELENQFCTLQVDDENPNVNDPDIDIKVEDMLDELTIHDNKAIKYSLPLVDMQYEDKGRKGKKLKIVKDLPFNPPNKNLAQVEKMEPIKRKRSGEADEIDEEAADEA
jgi:hypothetical protein